MMNKSKKGVTLVELVIACVIMVMLGGACTAVLVSGQKLFISGSKTANNQLEANLLQTTILNALPKMLIVDQDSVTDVKAAITADVGGAEKIDCVGIYFEGSAEDPIFTISRNGSNITIHNVTKFEYTLKKLGSSETAKTQFVYTAELADGSEITGGVVLGNMTFKKEVEAKGISGNHSLASENKALYFSTKKDDGT